MEIDINEILATVRERIGELEMELIIERVKYEQLQKELIYLKGKVDIPDTEE